MKEKKVSIQKIEQIFLKITTHPLFLGGVGVALNLSAYRKLIRKKLLQSLWLGLELPNRLEQEKILYLLSELEARLARLERRLTLQNLNQETSQQSHRNRFRRPFIDESSFQ